MGTAFLATAGPPQHPGRLLYFLSNLGSWAQVPRPGTGGPEEHRSNCVLVRATFAAEAGACPAWPTLAFPAFYECTQVLGGAMTIGNSLKGGPKRPKIGQKIAGGVLGPKALTVELRVNFFYVARPLRGPRGAARALGD